jgi:pimeloyl-ACP methyl ester carboxylesterase
VLLDLGWWAVNGMVRAFPRLMITSMFRATTTREFRAKEEVGYVMSHPEARAAIQALMDTQIPLSVRKPGLDNDLEQLAGLPVSPPEQIRCPTLVVHGKLDGNVPFSHGERAAKAISGAELHVVEGGGHLVCAGPKAEEVRTVVTEFLRKHASRPSPSR